MLVGGNILYSSFICLATSLVNAMAFAGRLAPVGVIQNSAFSIQYSIFFFSLFLNIEFRTPNIECRSWQCLSIQDFFSSGTSLANAMAFVGRLDPRGLVFLYQCFEGNMKGFVDIPYHSQCQFTFHRQYIRHPAFIPDNFHQVF